MGERYERVFSLPGEQYLEGAPVVIAAGALLKDRQTGGILAQLKFRNIRPAEIKALTAEVYPGDLSGRPLGGAVERLYLDLSVRRGEEFGQKQAIPLPDAATRTFSVRVTEVVFADLSTWKAPDAPWEPLPEKVLARTAIRHELMEQYLSEYGLRAEYLPWRTKDVRLCPCGALNLTEEPVCYACGAKAPPADFGVETLREHWDALLPEREEKARREAREKKRKRGVLSAVAALVVVVAVWPIVKANLPRYSEPVVSQSSEQGEASDPVIPVSLDQVWDVLVGKTFVGTACVGNNGANTDRIELCFVDGASCELDYSVRKRDGSLRISGWKTVKYTLRQEDDTVTLYWDDETGPIQPFQVVVRENRITLETANWRNEVIMILSEDTAKDNG